MMPQYQPCSAPSAPLTAVRYGRASLAARPVSRPDQDDRRDYCLGQGSRDPNRRFRLLGRVGDA